MLTFLGFDRYNPGKSDVDIAFTVIMARFENKWIFVQHKKRKSLECAGGKREAGESLLASARRELREESGAVRFDLKPLVIYRIYNEFSGKETKGLLCYALVHELGPLGDSEIGGVYLMKSCPEHMTYPAIMPLIYEYVTERF